MTADGFLDIDIYQQLLEREPQIGRFHPYVQCIGTINPAKEMIQTGAPGWSTGPGGCCPICPSFSRGCPDLDADFLAFSAHKMCGPTGIGVLYGKQEMLEAMPPFLGGGDMIKRVQLRSFTPNEIPYKFEAGTPAIAEAVGLGAAVDYLDAIGMEKVAAHENEIIAYAMERLEEVPGVQVFGPSAEKRGGVTSFTLAGIHPHDISQVLDASGIAIRAGHHCAMPLHEKLGLAATARASFYIYSKKEEVDKLIEALYTVRDLFGM